MSRANKRKGAQFETDVAAYLKHNGFPDAERRVMGGSLDRGDIAGVPGWCLELKNLASVAEGVRIAIDEARIEAVNAGAEHFAGVVKRRQKPVSEAFVVMPLAEFVELIRPN